MAPFSLAEPTTFTLRILHPHFRSTVDWSDVRATIDRLGLSHVSSDVVYTQNFTGMQVKDESLKISCDRLQERMDELCADLKKKHRIASEVHADLEIGLNETFTDEKKRAHEDKTERYFMLAALERDECARRARMMQTVPCYQPPMQMVQAPMQMVQPPMQMVQAPMQMVQAPMQMVQAPMQMVQAPVQAAYTMQVPMQAPVPQQVPVKVPVRVEVPVPYEVEVPVPYDVTVVQDSVNVSRAVKTRETEEWEKKVEALSKDRIRWNNASCTGKRVEVIAGIKSEIEGKR